MKKDSELSFPHFTVLKASAGSGKTHALTRRYVQFLLSERVPKNSLNNILAITFTNNAAREMKERILDWLKAVVLSGSLSLKIHAEKFRNIAELTDMDEARLRGRASKLIDTMLTNYSDFRVTTIDSFMTRIFTLSAVDLERDPDFDILMNNEAMINYAFDVFLKSVAEGTEEEVLFADVIPAILEQKTDRSSYLWDPSKEILEEIKKIYRKLSHSSKRLASPDTEECRRERGILKKQIERQCKEIEALIARSGISPSKGSSFEKIKEDIASGDFTTLMTRGFVNLPVKKTGLPEQKAGQFHQIEKEWRRLEKLTREYTNAHARYFYAPFAKVYGHFHGLLDRVKKQEGVVFIEDINYELARYLKDEIVPDVYFRIGDTVFHYLIDEFQDTSALQWKNLAPLIENSLASGGSCFVVGDTKQAIYRFRSADYRIMRQFESAPPFPSVKGRHFAESLDTNYRSTEAIVGFNRTFFTGNCAAQDDFRQAGEKSGLCDYIQQVKEGNKNTGHVEIKEFAAGETGAEREHLIHTVAQLKQRGYRYSDIAVITRRNEDVVNVSAWLSEAKVPFISFSSLDIRKNKTTCELLALLNFLDSPRDNLSLASFLLGDVFMAELRRAGMPVDLESMRSFVIRSRDGHGLLYTALRDAYPQVWAAYFEELFKVIGYKPLYDLIAGIYRTFNIFVNHGETQEATLIKLLEVVKNFEEEGRNSLRDFLDFADEDRESEKSAWDIDIPRDKDAVRIMTIHKAKGLGFAVTIVLLYGAKRGGKGYYTVEDGEEISLWKITKKMTEKDETLAKIYTAEEMDDLVDVLNGLYVAFTRAEKEMYVLWVDRNNDKMKELLPAKAFPVGTMPQQPPQKAKEEKTAEAAFELRHAVQQAAESIAEEMTGITLKERRRGEYIHGLLAAVEFADRGLAKRIEQQAKKLRAEGMAGIPSSANDAVEQFITGSGREYFTQRPGRRVYIEQEFADANGRLFRMDRVIADDAEVTVIDFKTGGKADAATHEKQIKTYMAILKELFPGRKISGVLGYIDDQEVQAL